MPKNEPADNNSSDKDKKIKELEDRLSTSDSQEDLKELLQAKLASQKRFALATMVVGLIVTGALLFIFWPRPEVIVREPPRKTSGTVGSSEQVKETPSNVDTSEDVQETPSTVDTSEDVRETPGSIDTFEDGSLSEWSHDVLNTWATYSHDYGVTVDRGDKVAFIQGGISNGGCGNQAIVREDLRGDDMKIRCKIKLDTGHGTRVNGGLVARYRSIGRGYRSTILYNQRTGKTEVRLQRMDGTEPGPNYKYQVERELLAGPISLPDFDPTEWHEFELDVNVNQIEVRVDGREYIEVRDSRYAYGAPGIIFGGSNGGGMVYCDDFSIH